MHKIISCLIVMAACLMTMDSSFGFAIGCKNELQELATAKQEVQRLRDKLQEFAAAKQEVKRLRDELQEFAAAKQEVERLGKELERLNREGVHYGWAVVAASLASLLGIFLGTRTVKNWRSTQKQEHSNE
ncbi:MAG: hypothetical protein LBI87_08470 [Candidatus Accumulibacter sp.]|jgi:ferric-dicitrate binding protein FerR (iron transport regulator)|nr:hypothetical protein [Accumulibacter sp.]